VATARVQVTIEIERGTWGDDCTVAQVHDQAGREAIEEVNRWVADTRRIRSGALLGLRIVGTKVVMVTTRPEGG
jgi:hypothetical protein